MENSKGFKMWEIFKYPSQAEVGLRMKSSTDSEAVNIKRRGRVEGRVGILIEFTDGTDVAVVDAKNKWLVEGTRETEEDVTPVT